MIYKSELSRTANKPDPSMIMPTGFFGPTPSPLFGRFVYDFELCETLDELKQCFAYINEHGCALRFVTQDTQGSYTVFFDRWRYG